MARGERKVIDPCLLPRDTFEALIPHLCVCLEGLVLPTLLHLPFPVEAYPPGSREKKTKLAQLHCCSSRWALLFNPARTDFKNKTLLSSETSLTKLCLTTRGLCMNSKTSRVLTIKSPFIELQCLRNNAPEELQSAVSKQSKHLWTQCHQLLTANH